MNRQRMSSSGSVSWFDPSQVFADTQRVDLFNDPPWVATPDPSPKRSTAGSGREGSRWTTAKSAVASRLPLRRGQHSHRVG
ncbi:MAG TPA: hypothetical protein VII76_15850 [Acidimicrobiales bacterium]